MVVWATRRPPRVPLATLVKWYQTKSFTDSGVSGDVPRMTQGRAVKSYQDFTLTAPASLKGGFSEEENANRRPQPLV